MGRGCAAIHRSGRPRRGTARYESPRTATERFAGRTSRSAAPSSARRDVFSVSPPPTATRGSSRIPHPRTWRASPQHLAFGSASIIASERTRRLEGDRDRRAPAPGAGLRGRPADGCGAPRLVLRGLESLPWRRRTRARDRERSERGGPSATSGPPGLDPDAGGILACSRGIRAVSGKLHAGRLRRHGALRRNDRSAALRIPSSRGAETAVAGRSVRLVADGRAYPRDGVHPGAGRAWAGVSSSAERSTRKDCRRYPRHDRALAHAIVSTRATATPRPANRQLFRNPLFEYADGCEGQRSESMPQLSPWPLSRLRADSFRAGSPSEKADAPPRSGQQFLDGGAYNQEERRPAHQHVPADARRDWSRPSRRSTRPRQAHS